MDEKHAEKILHYLASEEYKKEQAQLPMRLRYENTIVRALQLIETDRKALEKRRNINTETQRGAGGF